MMLSDFPEILTPNIEMRMPNEEICFFEGALKLKWYEKLFDVKGKIIFKWIPNLSVYFYGKLPNKFDHALHLLLGKKFEIELSSESPSFSLKGAIISYRENEENSITCILKPPVEIGDTGSAVECVCFEVANLVNLIGAPVRSGQTGYTNRIILENNESIIILDKLTDYNDLRHKLEEVGGYQLLYTGKLTLKSGENITFSKADSILNALSYFLQFVNGRKAFPLFRIGLSQEKKVWYSISPYYNDPLNDSHKYVHSWASGISDNGLSGLWHSFYDLWGNKADQDCLKNVLQWYVIANSNSALIEGSIVLIQNALELLFHWLISEKARYVSLQDSDRLSASSKIGFLLSYFNIASEVPLELQSLNSYAKKNNLINAPEAFIKIRNCIVHPSLKKRKILNEIDAVAKVEALHLGVWFVEVIILKLLNYKGEFENRCKAVKYKSSREQFV